MMFAQCSIHCVLALYSARLLVEHGARNLGEVKSCWMSSVEMPHSQVFEDVE